jgi:hypothetical protein
MKQSGICCLQACKRALRQLGPLTGSDAINTMFQNHLLDGAVLHYGEFINDLCKVIVSWPSFFVICQKLRVKRFSHCGYLYSEFNSKMLIYGPGLTVHFADKYTVLKVTQIFTVKFRCCLLSVLYRVSTAVAYFYTVMDHKFSVGLSDVLPC